MCTQETALHNYSNLTYNSTHIITFTTKVSKEGKRAPCICIRTNSAEPYYKITCTILASQKERELKTKAIEPYRPRHLNPAGSKHVVLLPTQWPRGLGREFSREVFHPKFLPEAFTFYRCSNSRLHQLCK